MYTKWTAFLSALSLLAPPPLHGIGFVNNCEKQQILFHFCMVGMCFVQIGNVYFIFNKSLVNKLYTEDCNHSESFEYKQDLLR